MKLELRVYGPLQKVILEELHGMMTGFALLIHKMLVSQMQALIDRENPSIGKFDELSKEAIGHKILQLYREILG